MKTGSAAILFAIVCASILTAWVPARWPLSMLEIGSYLLALAWIVKLAFSDRWPRVNVVLLPFAFNVFWGGVQLMFHWTVAPSETVRAILAWGAYLALVFVALQIFDSSHRVERLLSWLLAFGFTLCVVSTLQTFTAPGKVFWLFAVQDPVFLMGPFVNHAYYAAFIELLLPLALIPAVSDPARRLRYCLIAGAMVASVIASASRAGFVLVSVETIVVVLLCARRDDAGVRRVFPVLGAILLLAAGLTAVVGWDALGQRFLKKDPSRLEILYSSVAMIREHAGVGVGMGAWPSVYPFYARYDDGLFVNQAHNDWAQWTAEGGVLTLVAMVFLAGWTVRRTRKHLWCIGALFVFAHAFVDYPFQKPPIAALVFLLLGAAAMERGSRRNMLS